MVSCEDATRGPATLLPDRAADPDETILPRSDVAGSNASAARPGLDWAADSADTSSSETRASSGPAQGAVGAGSWSHPELSPRRPIGRGGQGEVWEAVQTALGRTIAVKRLLLGHSDETGSGPDDSDRRSQFLAEAVTAARLEHPSIVPVHDLTRADDGAPLLVMKRVRGRPWSEVLAEDRRDVPAADFLARHLQVLVSVAQAVSYAHEQGVLHRDLKPAQVLIGRFGEVTLLDWGLAVSFRSSPDGSWIAPPAAEAHNPAGTPAYMAPEQTTTESSGLCPATDVYLLGGILYLLVTGVRPHEAPTAAEAFDLAARGAVVSPPHGHPPQADLLALAIGALSFSPSDRPATAREFLGTLDAIVTGSSRRREARRIAEDAQNALDGAGEGLYAALPGLRAELSRAIALAPGDRDVAAARERASESLAAEALRRGDLWFARFTAEEIVDPSRKQAILAGVEGRQAQQHRIRRQRRVAVGLAALLSVVSIAAALFVVVQKGLAERAVRQRNRAQALSGFLVESFSERLLELGRSDLLAAVAEPVVKDYQSEPFDELTPPEVFEYARALRLSAEALVAHDNANIALVRAGEAVRLLESLPPAAAGPDRARRLSRAYRTRSAIRARLGLLLEALKDSEASLSIEDGRMAAEPGQPDVALAAAQARASRVERLWTVGRRSDAQREAGVAMVASERAVALASESLAARTQLLELLVAEAGRDVSRGRTDEARRGAERALALATALVRGNPGAAPMRSLLAGAHGAMAVALADVAPPVAIRSARNGLVASEEGLGLDPTSSLLRQDVALARIRLGYTLLKAGHAREAIEPLGQAGRELDELLRVEPRRLRRLLSRGLALRLLSFAAWQVEGDDRALALMTDARRRYADAVAIAPSSLDAAVGMAAAARDEKAILEAAGRGRESGRLVVDAEARLARFFAGNDPGLEAREARDRLLAQLGSSVDDGARHGPDREAVPARPTSRASRREVLSPGSLRLAF